MLGFTTGLSALNAARLAIQTAGNNLANAATPGYSRQRVDLAANLGSRFGGFDFGGGVSIVDVERITDEFLVKRLRGQYQATGRRDALYETFLDVESVYGEPGESGIAARLAQLFNGLSGLASAPDDSTVRSGLIQEGVTLAEAFHQVRRGLAAVGTDVRSRIESTTADINRIAQNLAFINVELPRASATGNPPSALLDRQSRLLEELSQIADIEVTDAGFGRVNVTIGGQIVVTPNDSRALDVRPVSGNEVEVVLAASGIPLSLSGGRLSGLLDMQTDAAGDRLAELDLLARSMILEFNRVHSTGVPEGGGYTSLSSTNSVIDANGNGDYADELLANAGFPFGVSQGHLFVTVFDEATGSQQLTRIDIDPNSDTVGEFVARLNAIDGMSASLDGIGRIHLSAASGRRFHFGGRYAPDPNAAGTFGSASAQVSATNTGPFALTNGSTMSIAVDGGPPQTVTFNTLGFANIAQATPDEVAAVIAAQVSGVQTSVVDGRVVITSATTGSTSSIQITDGAGSPAGILGLSTATATGSASAVQVSIGGEPQSIELSDFTFRPVGSGQIGVTPGLQVQVLDTTGSVVTTLEVGEGYDPGDELALFDGLTISFSAGDIDGAAGDFFNLEVAADADTSDVLVAFGINGFFSGADAAGIDIAESLVERPDLLAIGSSGAVADNVNVLRLLQMRDGGLDDLEGATIEEFYNASVAAAGADTSRARLNRDVESLLLESIQNRLEQARGVSIDEELANIERYQQSYEAAARFMTALNEISQTLLSI